jgi:hypothetical protein
MAPSGRAASSVKFDLGATSSLRPRAGLGRARIMFAHPGPHADCLYPGALPGVAQPVSMLVPRGATTAIDVPALPNLWATEVAPRGRHRRVRGSRSTRPRSSHRRQRGRELIPKRAAPAPAAQHRRDHDDNDDGNDGSPTDDQSLHRVTSCSQLVFVLQPLQTPAHRCSFPAGRDARSDERNCEPAAPPTTTAEKTRTAAGGS